jgi:hypothetical protein
MKLINALSFLVIFSSGSLVCGSNEGVGAHHRRTQVRKEDRTFPLFVLFKRDLINLFL